MSNDIEGPISPLIDVPAEMITDIAVGLEPAANIALRYGYGSREFESLQRQSWFVRKVGQAREDIEASGWTIKEKARMLAEALLVDAFRAAKNSDSVQNKLDVAKFAAKLGDLEPKPNAGQLIGAAGGVNITITIPEYKSTSKKVVDITNYEDSTASQVPMPTDRPGYIKTPVFIEALSGGLEEIDDV